MDYSITKSQNLTYSDEDLKSKLNEIEKLKAIIKNTKNDNILTQENKLQIKMNENAICRILANKILKVKNSESINEEKKMDTKIIKYKEFSEKKNNSVKTIE